MGSTGLWIDVGSYGGLGLLVLLGLAVARGLRASLLASTLPLLGSLDDDPELARHRADTA